MARVLLMEDDLTVSLELAQGLTDAGHEVETCRNANEGLALVGENLFDLAVIDIFVREGAQVVPEGGMLLISRLRGGERTQTIPIIAISGSTRHQGLGHILDLARQLGADETLAKPFDIARLRATVDAVLDPDRSASDPKS